MKFKHWLAEHDMNLHQDIDFMVKKGLSQKEIIQKLKQDNRWPKEKLAKQLKLSISRKLNAKVGKAKENINWPNLNDEQISQNIELQFKTIEKYLKEVGATLHEISPISNSRYYVLTNQQKIRVSDHHLPFSDERSFYAEKNPRIDIVIDRFRTPEQTIEFMKDTIDLN